MNVGELLQKITEALQEGNIDIEADVFIDCQQAHWFEIYPATDIEVGEKDNSVIIK